MECDKFSRNQSTLSPLMENIMKVLQMKNTDIESTFYSIYHANRDIEIFSYLI